MTPTTRLITTGQDKFGAFEVFRNPRGEEEMCIAGEHTPQLMLVYLDGFPHLPEGIDGERTILVSPEAAIGIDCGCYAKFHRQIAHIVDRQTTQQQAKKQTQQEK